MLPSLDDTKTVESIYSNIMKAHNESAEKHVPKKCHLSAEYHGKMITSLKKEQH